MTTTLDIIDTAVKIGLGATIGGLTSYVLAVRSQNHEKHARDILDKREFIKELSLKLEKVDHLNGETALQFYSGELVNAKQANVSATEEICMASAIANIIGDDDLVATIEKMSDLLDNIYTELNSEIPSENVLYNYTV